MGKIRKAAKDYEQLTIISIMIIVVMGVSGCGKSTIGRMLAERLSLPFFDADDFHPQGNVSKMSRGVPLTDEDRYPWLVSLSGMLQEEEKNKGAVLACSALKEKYREILQLGTQEKISWVYLEGTEEVIRERMKKRSEHFMPDALLTSQFNTLEKPLYAHCLSIEKNPASMVDEIVLLLNTSAIKK